MRNDAFMICEKEYSGFPWSTAEEHLSRAIRFRTTSHVDTTKTDYSEFDAQIEWLLSAYPRIMAAGSHEVIGHSLLLRIPGTDPSLRPALFIAHEDTVPLVPGTEQDWLHGPYDGDIADGFIWGRGAIDIKNMLIGELEAAEYLLSLGKQPVRPLWFAFGEDEETLNTGAASIAEKLKAEGVTLEYVLDEGIPNTTDAAVYGAPGTLICPIGICEKGYADLYLRAHASGGHSSDPVHGTSLGHLAQAIAAVLSDPPAPALQDCNFETLRLLKDRITEEPMRAMVSDPEKHKEELLRYFASQAELYYQVCTTVAPTMITPGSAAGNVMPGDMEAVINFRLCPHDTTDSLLTHVRALLPEGSGIETGYVQCINASVPSLTDTEAFRALQEALGHFYRDLLFIPGINKGCTDAHNYECICRACYRIEPFLEENEIHDEGMHGVNERISVRAFHQGIRVLIRFMENTVFTEKT